MSTDLNRLHYLLERYIDDSGNEAERLELLHIIHDGRDDEAIRGWMDQSRNRLSAGYRLDDGRAEEIFQGIMGGEGGVATVGTETGLGREGTVTPEKAPVIPIKKRKTAVRWWAAAAILVLLGLRTYLYFFKPAAPEITRSAPTSPDVLPGGNKAMLRLANGRTIVLDSARNGDLASFGNIRVIKKGSGELIYAAAGAEGGGGGTKGGSAGAADGDIGGNGLNVLSTPRGGIFRITLPDGTGAWLNAASSITYPTRFTERRREVSITGEVYFEVKKDLAHPFIVSLVAADQSVAGNGDKSPGQGSHWLQVEVLGTHFNINDYRDAEDPQARTTLLEGAVKVSAHGVSRILKPGEQGASARKDKGVILNDRVDLENVMAWKNGEIMLNHGNVQKLMWDISRWYDVDVEYLSAIPEGKYSGSIDRNVPLSSVLKVLKAYGVGTRLSGKKVTVL